MPAQISPAATSDDSLSEQAAGWIVRLSADSAAERAQAQAGFDAWKQADPRHAAAAAEMEYFVSRLQGTRLPAGDARQPARAAFDAAFPQPRRSRGKRIGAALALALALGLPGWAVLKVYPPAYLMADTRTAAGHWETRTLEDGTRITLRGGTAVNFHYDAQRRAIELIKGEMLVEVAKDAARPFLVETGQGSIRALGTRFVVDEHDAVTTLSMLESRTQVRSAAQLKADAAGVEVAAGQRIRIDANGMGPVERIDGRSIDDAWKYRQLVVNDKPLPEVLDLLARNRPGLIRYDRRQLEGIRVSAVLPLEDSERALQLLKTNFPQLRMRQFSPYLLWVDRPG